MKEIKVKYIDKTIQFKTKTGDVIPEGYKLKHVNGKNTSACIDVYLQKETTFYPGTFTLCPLNIIIKVPEGNFSKLYLKSGVPLKFGLMLANSTGIIDYSFSGEKDIWQACLHKPYSEKDMFDLFQFFNPINKHQIEKPEDMRKIITPLILPAGTYIGQFEVIPMQEDLDIKETDEVSAESREGFGAQTEKMLNATTSFGEEVIELIPDKKKK